MTSTTNSETRFESPTLVQSLPIYYGWINVIVASIAMTATLPGRTHGLGLITEPLLADLSLTAIGFARINFFCAILGASFCIPVGWLIDRYGVRIVLTLVTLALGVSVLGMSRVGGRAELVLWLFLLRGFGQSALSLVSFSVISKWFRRRLGIAMAMFAVLLTFGFIGSVLSMGVLIEELRWRGAWNALGWTILGLVPLFYLFTRSSPESCGLEGDFKSDIEGELPARIDPHAVEEPQVTVWQALFSPAFWVLLLGSSIFNLVWSGVTLFNESILNERGIDAAGAAQIMAILAGVGLLANMVSGSLVDRDRILKLMGAGLVVLAIGLFTFPYIESLNGARLYAVAIGTSGGIVTVVFFAAWRHIFGSKYLGRIQGTAQLATVLASATGPVLIAEAGAMFGSYDPLFLTLAVCCLLLAGVAWFVKP